MTLIVRDEEVLEPAPVVADLSDTRGNSSCWTDAPNCQSDGRTPQPSRMAGLTIVELGLGLPKFRSMPPSDPQMSPPVARLSCAPVLDRSQSTTKLLLPSAIPRFCTLRHVRMAGLLAQ